MEFGLQGKTCLVTGASQGIGRATAISLAAEGANVAMVARTEADLESAAAEVRSAAAATVQVLCIQADVRVPDDLGRVHTEVRERLGPVDVLVNNAGTSQRGPFLEQSDDDWQDDFDLKVGAAIRLARLVIPDMQARGGGRIVNVTALVGKHPGPATAPTSVSRAAGIALTKVLSKEFGPDGILVNTVCIGTIESGQHDRRWQRDAPDLPREQYYAQLAKDRSIPLGRVGRADEAANLIVFLASEAGSFISGAAINVDGGQSHVV